MYNKMKVACPTYFKKFSCIGGKCENTCCKAWDIEIDKNTFEQYNAITDENAKLMLKKNIQVNEECISSDLDYGLIKLDHEEMCPFLDKNKYCTIYSTLGEEYLSNICTHFPRIMNKVDNNYEISLDVACYEAAKLILGEKEEIKFELIQKEFIKYIINDEYNTNSKKYRNTPIKYFKEIRIFSIKIMQNRKFDISQRLYILGAFIEGLEKISAYDCNGIPMFIKDFDMDSAAMVYVRDRNDYIFQVEFFQNIVNSYNMSEDNTGNTLKEFKDVLINGFDVKYSNISREDKKKYINAFNKYDREITEKYGYIFENYIVNFIYNYLFPFSESEDMFEGYLMLVLRYSFIRFYLFGIYINNIMDTDSEEHIIKFISIFGRSIEHDKNYLPNMEDYIEKNKYCNMTFAKKVL